MRIEFIKYNRERLPQFQTETTIMGDDNGNRLVRKRALTDEGRQHVLSMVDNYELIHSELKGAKLSKPKMDGEHVIFNYIKGDTLACLMLHCLMRNDHAGFSRLLVEYVELLRSYGIVHLEEFRSLEGLNDLFAKGFSLKNVECLKVTNMDLIFDNIVVDREGHKWVTDYEWVFKGPIPLSFIVYRSLYVFSIRHPEHVQALGDLDKVMRMAGFSAQFNNDYRYACEKFIDHVFGPNRNFLAPDEHQRSKFHLAREEDLRERIKEVELLTTNLQFMGSELTQKADHIMKLQAQIDQANVLIKKQSDINASSQVQIAQNIKEMQRMGKEMEELNDLVSERNDKIDRLSTDLIESNDIVNEMRTVIADNETTIAQNDATICDNLVRIEELNKRFAETQQEMLKLSDWAYRMKVRLDYIDSSPNVRRAERLSRLKDLAADTLRSEGVIEFGRLALCRLMPAGGQQRISNSHPSNLKDLNCCIEEGGNKVLVVFPIIPWEFRWQRPQQIVSRFAKNGYTVIFVSMNLTAKTKEYESENEAAADVVVGKIDDCIYQVWLSSKNKINLYHDKISEGDNHNLVMGLRAVLKETRARRITYLVQFPGWADLVFSIRKKVKGKIIFDCMDDHSGFSNNADEAIEDERRLIRDSDMVITTSEKLYEKATAENDRTIMVRNGTDFELFNKLSPNGQLDDVKGPIIGYYGAISDWFDIDMVAHCAEAHPQWTIILIGSTVGADVSKLEKMRNVRLLGEKPYKELPGFLHYFDVCIIPFKLNPLTMATNPVKFYEYLSSGKPVVSVRLPELECHKGLCYLADSRQAFCDQIQEALKEDDDDEIRKQRIAFAKNNSWDHRFKEIEEAMKEL